MDGRFLLLGLLLLAATLGARALGWSQTLWVWAIPFVLILLFLAAIGESPTAQVKRFFPDRE